MISATISLLSAGADAGPFDIFSDVDTYTVPFEVGVSKASLLAGYFTTQIPDGTSNIRVCSTGVCQNCVDITVSFTTTSSTSTLSSSTEITIINNTVGVTYDTIVMDSTILPPGPGLYPNPGGNIYLTSFASGTYNVTVTLNNVPNNNTTVTIDDGNLIQFFVYPAGISVSHSFLGVGLSGLATTITVGV